MVLGLLASGEAAAHTQQHVGPSQPTNSAVLTTLILRLLLKSSGGPSPAQLDPLWPSGSMSQCQVLLPWG